MDLDFNSDMTSLWKKGFSLHFSLFKIQQSTSQGKNVIINHQKCIKLSEGQNW